MSWGSTAFFCEPEQLQGATPAHKEGTEEMVAQTVQDIGIDVVKRWLDVAVFQTQEQARFDNDKDGWAKLVRWLRGRTAIGMEPSGGYVRDVAKALRSVDLPARNVNPHKLRRCVATRSPSNWPIWSLPAGSSLTTRSASPTSSSSYASRQSSVSSPSGCAASNSISHCSPSVWPSSSPASRHSRPRIA